MEDNKLIAKFMEWDFFDNNCCHHSEYCDDGMIPFEQLKFHSSWDWLMLVVEKIEGLTSNTLFGIHQEDEDCKYTHVRIVIDGWNTKINKYSDYGDFSHTNWMSLDCEEKVKSKIDAVYKIVVKFIKWYNENSRSGYEN